MGPRDDEKMFNHEVEREIGGLRASARRICGLALSCESRERIAQMLAYEHAYAGADSIVAFMRARRAQKPRTTA